LPRYIFSLYWAVVTFSTVGYGDFSAKSEAEAIFEIIFIIFDIFVHAHILGTITLAVIKGDKRTGRYRDLSTNLRQYSVLNQLPRVRFLGLLAS
jgi:Ion channel